eukprot:CAMPEP_0179347756 /NCGR_PEP_ID=MMETSP0797-20121207/73323_1 /TAXON_ID=47934 /ORGANISM="Dinophysis acuminata, Strain DAEP01" /LENGTH=58 /DNA_ID=CAMNT_0021062485 /DNA_START=55 /DNA_END=228 /DNA_ORIENTATION=+
MANSSASVHDIRSEHAGHARAVDKAGVVSAHSPATMTPRAAVLWKKSTLNALSSYEKK